MLYGIVLQKESAHHDLIGLRKLLDNAILEQLFYQTMSQETWDSLYAIQDDLEAYLRTGENNVQIIARKDIDFHRRLAAATNNIAVLTVYNSIVRITEDFLSKTIETILRHDAMTYFSESHRGILQKLAGSSLNDLHDRVEWSYMFWNTAFQEQEEDKKEQ